MTSFNWGKGEVEVGHKLQRTNTFKLPLPSQGVRGKEKGGGGNHDGEGRWKRGGGGAVVAGGGNGLMRWDGRGEERRRVECGIVPLLEGKETFTSLWGFPSQPFKAWMFTNSNKRHIIV